MDKNTKIGIAFGTLMFILTNGYMFTNAQILNRQLQLGMTGADVGDLQRFLVQDPSIYTGPVTNYFGNLTRTAVMKSQSLNGLSSVGRVGPQTLSLINSKMGGSVSTSTSESSGKLIFGTTVSNNNNVVTLTWNTALPTRGTVYYSTSPLTTYEHENSVVVSGSTVSSNIFNTTHSVQLTGVDPANLYYFSIYTTDQDGNVQMTWPATFKINSSSGTTSIPTINIPANNPGTTTTSTTTNSTTSATTSTSTGM